jgi:hypothetical protein
MFGPERNTFLPLMLRFPKINNQYTLSHLTLDSYLTKFVALPHLQRRPAGGKVPEERVSFLALGVKLLNI